LLWAWRPVCFLLLRPALSLQRSLFLQEPRQSIPHPEPEPERCPDRAFAPNAPPHPSRASTDRASALRKAATRWEPTISRSPDCGWPAPGCDSRHAPPTTLTC